MTVPGVPNPIFRAPSVVPGIVACQSPDEIARTCKSASSLRTLVPDVVVYPSAGMSEMRVIFGDARERGRECCEAARVRIEERVEDSKGIERSSEGVRVRRLEGSER